MNYPFTPKSSLSRLFKVTLALALIVTVLSGCSLIPGLGGSNETTEAATENTVSILPTVEETTEEPSTEPATVATVATVPTTEAVMKENVAVVKEQLSVRSSPSTGSRVITTLDAGDEVEVLRIEPIGTVQWAYVSSDTLNFMGWIVTDMLDMSNVSLSSGSTSTPGNDGTATVSTVATTATTATTPTVSSITGTGSSSSTPANSQTGVVNTNTLNIRATASTNGEKVGQYTYGDKITILETSNGWGRTDKGWVSMNYVTIQSAATSSSNTIPAGGTTGTITGTAVNIRSGAGTTNGVVGTYSKGDNVTILETTTVGTAQWGRTNKGWICMDYVNLTGGTSTATGTTGDTAATGNATVNTGLNIRSGAGQGYAVVGTLQQGATVTILETVNNWGRISQGWICLDYVTRN